MELNELNNKFKALVEEDDEEIYEGEDSEFEFITGPDTVVYSDGAGFSPWTSIGQIKNGKWLMFENGAREADDPMGDTKEEALEEWVDIVCSDFDYASDFYDFFKIEDDDICDLVDKYFGEENEWDDEDEDDEE